MILNGCLVVLFNPHIYVSRQGLDFDQGEARADMLQVAVTLIPFTILHYPFEIHSYNWITASWTPVLQQSECTSHSYIILVYGYIYIYTYVCEEFIYWFSPFILLTLVTHPWRLTHTLLWIDIAYLLRVVYLSLCAPFIASFSEWRHPKLASFSSMSLAISHFRLAPHPSFWFIQQFICIPIIHNLKFPVNVLLRTGSFGTYSLSLV